MSDCFDHELCAFEDERRGGDYDEFRPKRNSYRRTEYTHRYQPRIDYGSPGYIAPGYTVEKETDMASLLSASVFDMDEKRFYQIKMWIPNSRLMRSFDWASGVNLIVHIEPWLWSKIKKEIK